MSRFQNVTSFRHEAQPKIGVLVTNLGTPEAPTASALRRYLGEFLWDRRVIEIPRPLWWLILHGVILRVRPRRAARNYAKVWTDQGSPLLAMTRRQGEALQKELSRQTPGPIEVAVAMRYGTPSIGQTLRQLRDQGVRRLLVLPLYPQYSATTTGSTFDAVSRELGTWRWLPELRFVSHYHDASGYIDALAQSIRDAWSDREPGQRLLFSFHGLPKRMLLNGDPYHCECHKTARLVAERLALGRKEYQVAFQSRFGREEWLKPYSDHVLKEWAKQGVHSVNVICPGFAADCLETLEEVDIGYRETFLTAGGQAFHYIPALNDRADHITALANIIVRNQQGWPEASPDFDASERQAELAATAERAQALGANR